ncbi:MAG: NUDIX pyrophosphatase [Alphaproteobacteria bacterium]
MVAVRCDAVSVFLIRGAGADVRVLMLRRAGSLYRGEWCQVAGGIEDGEAPWAAALREVREETGLVPDRLYSADICEQFYDPPTECVVIIPVFVGFIDGAREVVLNDESSAFRWMTFAEAGEVVPFSGQRTTLAHIRREFVERPPPARQRIEIPR